MKVTLFAGLLLAGASIPALKTVPGSQAADAQLAAAGEWRPIAEMRGAVTPAAVSAQDELAELRETRRHLELAMERLEHEAEIRNLERSIERRQEMRKQQRELAEKYAHAEREHDELERGLERHEQEFEYGHERMSNALQHRLDTIEQAFEEHMQRTEAAHELQIRSSLRAAHEKGTPQDRLERIESELRLEMLERSQKDAQKFREQAAQIREEGERELRAYLEEHAEVQAQIHRHMSELGGMADELQREAEICEEDAEAQTELEELRMRLELVEHASGLESRYEEVERRIESLEDARDEDEEEEEEKDDDRWDDGDDDEDHDLEEVWGTIRSLQHAVAELRRDVDSLAKKVSVR